MTIYNIYQGLIFPKLFPSMDPAVRRRKPADAEGVDGAGEWGAGYTPTQPTSGSGRAS